MRVISAASGPVYVSAMAKSTASSDPCVSVKRRVPVNNPMGMPPIHVIPRPGSNSVTFNENARPGVALA